MRMTALDPNVDGQTLRMFQRANGLLQGGRVQDHHEAAVLMREVAERSGMAAAQYNMGSMYENGIGVPKNLALAVPWYSKAASQGLADAHHALGLCYELGKGVAINTVGRCKLKPVEARVKSAWFQRSKIH